jgi:predicted anti-sigma-YlaC factor YlaD
VKDMTRVHRGLVCERARSWAALAPDRELSELERKLLDAHLARCSACAAFAADVAAITAELRQAASAPLPHPVALPARRRREAYARVRAVGAAAAVALMAFGVASRAPLPMGEPQALPTPTASDFAEAQQLRDLRTEAELADRRERSANAFGNLPA